MSFKSPISRMKAAIDKRLDRMSIPGLVVVWCGVTLVNLYKEKYLMGLRNAIREVEEAIF